MRWDRQSLSQVSSRLQHRQETVKTFLCAEMILTTEPSIGCVAKIFAERKPLCLSLFSDHNEMRLKNYLQHKPLNWEKGVDILHAWM
jgi:hypothetical protein